MLRKKTGSRSGLRLRFETARDEQGFTMIEMIVALSVLATSMVILTGTLANSLRPLSLAKQRSSAVSAAQQYLEIARSLGDSSLGNQVAGTYVQNGVTVNDPGDATLTNASDPSIFMIGGKPYFGPGCPTIAPGSRCETIHGVTVPNNPFNPHAQTITRFPSVISLWVYVTDVDPATNLRRVTVRAQFSRSAIGGVSNVVSMETLIIPDHTGSAVANDIPLSGNANVINGSTTITTAVGNPLPPPTQLQITNPATYASAVGSSRKQVSCSATQASMALVGGSSWGGDQLSTIIEDDPMSPSWNAQGYSTQTKAWPTAALPVDIGSLVTLGPTTSSQSCMSSVVGSDLVHPGLPYGQGVNSPGPTETVTVSDSPGLTGFGSVQLLSLGNAATTSTVNYTPTADSVTSTAQQQAGDTKLIVIAASGLSTPILATNGLLRIEALTSTVTAYGVRTGTPAVPTVSASTQMKIWIYDPLLRIPLGGANGCTSRSAAPDPVGYCIIVRAITDAPVAINLTESIPELGGQSVRWTTVLNINPGATGTSVTPTKSVWQAQLNTATATVHMCVTTSADCSSASGKTVDQTVTMDLGSLLAQAVSGL